MNSSSDARGSSHRILLFVASILIMVAATACGPKQRACVDKSKPSLDLCKVDGEKMQKEILSLKRQLAQALANPGSIKVDPSVLMIDGKHIMPKVKEGNLSQQQVVATISRNKGVLKACYERAMKKNGSLRRQKITLSLSFKIKPTGLPMSIVVRPNYDGRMIDCMKKAIKRWRFPQFSGQAIDVESPLTLTPKN